MAAPTGDGVWKGNKGMMMHRYHVWTHADMWDENPVKSGADFLGLFNDVEEIIKFLWIRLREKKLNAKESYAVVTMGDMSPAGLSETGGIDPDDICVEWIGHFTAEEAETLMPKWQKRYADELNSGCWITTLIGDEHPDLGYSNDDIHVWDTEAQAWRSFNEDNAGRGLENDGIKYWRKKLTENVTNRHDESDLPLPQTIINAG